MRSMTIRLGRLAVRKCRVQSSLRRLESVRGRGSVFSFARTHSSLVDCANAGELTSSSRINAIVIRPGNMTIGLKERPVKWEVRIVSQLGL